MIHFNSRSQLHIWSSSRNTFPWIPSHIYFIYLPICEKIIFGVWALSRKFDFFDRQKQQTWRAYLNIFIASRIVHKIYRMCLHFRSYSDLVQGQQKRWKYTKKTFIRTKKKPPRKGDRIKFIACILLTLILKNDERIEAFFLLSRPFSVCSLLR